MPDDDSSMITAQQEVPEVSNFGKSIGLGVYQTDPRSTFGYATAHNTWDIDTRILGKIPPEEATQWMAAETKYDSGKSDFVELPVTLSDISDSGFEYVKSEPKCTTRPYFNYEIKYSTVPVLTRSAGKQLKNKRQLHVTKTAKEQLTNAKLVTKRMSDKNQTKLGRISVDNCASNQLQDAEKSKITPDTKKLVKNFKNTKQGDLIMATKEFDKGGLQQDRMRSTRQSHSRFSEHAVSYESLLDAVERTVHLSREMMSPVRRNTVNKMR